MGEVREVILESPTVEDVHVYPLQKKKRLHKQHGFSGHVEYRGLHASHSNRKTQHTTVVIIKAEKTTTTTTTNRVHVYVHVGVSFREYACVDMTLMGERG